MANFSSQLNFSTGQWQIDGNPPGWLNTGFKPIIAPDVWFPISFRYFIDFPNSKFSFLSTTWGAQEFTVPATMQGVPFQITNWQPVSALQIQMEVLNPGSVSTLYQDLAVSDHSDSTDSAEETMDCTMTNWSITQNWAEGTCTDYRGNVRDMRTTYWTWLLDYGL